MDREFEQVVAGLIKMIFNLLKSLFYGIKKLRKLSVLIGFLFFCLFPLLTLKIQSIKDKIFDLQAPGYIQYIMFYTVLLLPVLYLLFIGSMQDKNQSKYKKIFEEIGFSAQGKNYPYYIGKRVEGKKVVMYFKSNIPIPEWQKAIDRLENGLDCNILMIREGSSKKIAELTTVPNSCRIPENIEWSDEYMSEEDGVLVIGEGALEKIKFDLNRTPHVLSAGETGSGKSVLLRLCLWQMARKGCQIFMIDFKGGVEFGKQYEKFGEVITDRERALEVLKELSLENIRRLNLFRDLEVKNLKQYNKKTGENLQRVGVFIDEIGEMMDKKGAAKQDKAIMEQLEGIISSLARLTRATGINLFLGVQRPDANVLTGQIKNNIPVRISGRFADKPASEIVLGNTMAVDLPDIKGRFLIKIGNEFTQFQAYYFDDDTMMNEHIMEIDNQKEGLRTSADGGTKKPRKRSASKQIEKIQPETSSFKDISKEITDFDPTEVDFDEKILWEPDLKKEQEVNLKDEQEVSLKNEIEMDFDYSNTY